MCLRTALHRAFYWGNYQCAAVLLAANAHLSLADFKVRVIEIVGFQQVAVWSDAHV